MSEEKLTRAAIVTGGSRGIGRAVCVALAKQGCNVVVNYCHGAEPAEQTAALCRAEGVQAVTVQADVSTAEGCKALFDAAAEAFGRVDVLVNNAGITLSLIHILAAAATAPSCAATAWARSAPRWPISPSSPRTTTALKR